MLELSYEEKIELIGSLNWDTLDNCEDMLVIIEGKTVRSEAFTRDKLFVRSLERLPWHYVTFSGTLIRFIKTVITSDSSFSKCSGMFNLSRSM